MLTEKVIIITGAAGGIGRAIAKKFAASNYFVTLVDIDKEGLDKLFKELVSEYDAQCLVCAGDLADIDFLKSVVEKTVELWGRVDALVNNAAWRTIETMRTIGIPIWKRTIDICLTAPAFLTKWVALEMEKQNLHGVIINVSSIMASRPSGTSPAYIAAKGALDSLTRELAVTYGRSGIRVAGVAAGYIDTDISNDYENTDGKNISEKLTRELIDYLPLARAGKSDEVAEAIYWLCQDNSAYITGTNLVIDGGLLSNFSKYSFKQIQFPEEF